MKKTVNFLSVLVALIFSIAVNSEQKIQIKIGSENYFLTQYHEGEKYFVDVFKVEANGFQNRESHFDFDALEIAQIKFTQLTQLYKSKKMQEKLI